MKKNLILLIFLVFCLSAYASNWQEIMYKYYVDTSSIKYNGNSATVWVKFLNQGDMKPIQNQKVWFKIQNIQLDCYNKQLNVMSSSTYNLKGQAIETFDYSTPYYTKIVPDSVGEGLYNYVCGY